MATILPIGIGTVPNDGLGDTIRLAFDKCNQNFNALNVSAENTMTQLVKANVALTKGQAVYVSGADGTNVLVSKASNTTDVTSSKTLGLITTNLALNASGSVMVEGILSGLNTSTATAGDPVWLGVDGALIYGVANKPVAPAHMVFIGYVLRANSSNGEIYVKVQNGFELEELHNVSITSLANNQSLIYESATSLWKNKTLATINSQTLVNGGNIVTGNISGTGTANYIPRFNTANALINSSIFDSGTNVGIGTANPGVRFVNSGAAFVTGPTLGSGTVGNQALLSSDGLFGMYSGVSSNGDVWHQVQRNDGNTAVYNLVFQPSGGNIYLGTTSSIYATPSKFQILFNGAIEYGINFKTNASAAIPISFIASTGSQVGYIIYDNTGTAYTSISDYRLKEDLNVINGLDLISKINVYDYKWKSADKRSYGVMAHELQEVVPQVVFGEKDGKDMQSVDYSMLVPILIQGIKEQQVQIEELKNLIKN